MKKFSLGVLVGLVITFSISKGIHFLNENFPYGYNVNWIIGSTYDEIVEKYGEFVFGPLDTSLINFPTVLFAYQTKKDTHGFSGPIDDEYFIIWFNEDGVAYKVQKDYIVPGG